MREPPLRLLIVVSWSCVIASIAMGFLLPATLPTHSAELYEEIMASQSAWLDTLSPLANLAVAAGAALLIVLNFASAIGMFLFQRWGRTLAVATTALLFAAAPFAGWELTSAIEGVLADFASLTWGAALALAHWSPAAARFRAPSTSADAP